MRPVTRNFGSIREGKRERTGDLRGTRDQGRHAFRLSIGHLAPRVTSGGKSHSWERPTRRSRGPRVVESLEILAEIFHPELFPSRYEGKGWMYYAAEPSVEKRGGHDHRAKKTWSDEGRSAGGQQRRGDRVTKLVARIGGEE